MGRIFPQVLFTAKIATLVCRTKRQEIIQVPIPSDELQSLLPDSLAPNILVGEWVTGRRTGPLPEFFSLNSAEAPEPL